MLCESQNLMCFNRNIAQSLCSSQKCYYQACVCSNLECGCLKNHANCKIIKITEITNLINQKRISSSQIKQDVENLFTETFKYLFQVRKCILDDLAYLGLNESEKLLIQKIQSSRSDQIRGCLVEDVRMNMNTDYMEQIQKELANNLYVWHLEQNYKRPFEKLLNSFEPQPIIHQTSSQILSESEGSKKSFKNQNCLDLIRQQSEQYFSEQQTKIPLHQENKSDDSNLMKFLRSGFRCLSQQKRNKGRH